MFFANRTFIEYSGNAGLVLSNVSAEANIVIIDGKSASVKTEVIERKVLAILISKLCFLSRSCPNADGLSVGTGK